MRVILALVIGILIGIAAVWYLNRDTRTPWQKAGDQVRTTAQSAGTALEEKVRSLDLDSGKITEELNRTGRVIRDKAGEAGRKIADATADARITAAIKAKLLGQAELSAWDISVSTTDGIVTLSGTVPAPDRIGKAIVLALDTDGVHRVISTLQVKPK